MITSDRIVRYVWVRLTICVICYVVFWATSVWTNQSVEGEYCLCVQYCVRRKFIHTVKDDKWTRWNTFDICYVRLIICVICNAVFGQNQLTTFPSKHIKVSICILWLCVIILPWRLNVILLNYEVAVLQRFLKVLCVFGFCYGTYSHSVSAFMAEKL